MLAHFYKQGLWGKKEEYTALKLSSIQNTNDKTYLQAFGKIY